MPFVRGGGQGEEGGEGYRKKVSESMPEEVSRMLRHGGGLPLRQCSSTTLCLVVPGPGRKNARGEGEGIDIA